MRLMRKTDPLSNHAQGHPLKHKPLSQLNLAAGIEVLRRYAECPAEQSVEVERTFPRNLCHILELTAEMGSEIENSLEEVLDFRTILSLL